MTSQDLLLTTKGEEAKVYERKLQSAIFYPSLTLDHEAQAIFYNLLHDSKHRTLNKRL